MRGRSIERERQRIVKESVERLVERQILSCGLLLGHEVSVLSGPVGAPSEELQSL